MTPHGLLTTIGATALGIGIITGGAVGVPAVFAQDATPPAAVAPAQPEQDRKAEFEAQRAAAYDSFVAALAGELGSDEAAVDTAIRAALTQQVDAREAAGELDEEAAAAARAVIEVSDAPLFLGMGGRGMHGFDSHHGGPGGDHRGFEGRGPRGGSDKPGNERPDDDSSATLPDADGAADQAAPAPVTPAEDSVL